MPSTVYSNISPADLAQYEQCFDPDLSNHSQVFVHRPVPPNLGQQKGSYTFNTPVGDMSDSFIGRQLANMMNKQISKMIAGMEDTPTALLMEAMVKELPLRGMLMTGDGSLNREMLDALLVMINGEFFKGFGALIKAARNK